jgi:hypothetical protein
VRALRTARSVAPHRPVGGHSRFPARLSAYRPPSSRRLSPRAGTFRGERARVSCARAPEGDAVHTPMCHVAWSDRTFVAVVTSCIGWSSQRNINPLGWRHTGNTAGYEQSYVGSRPEREERR